MSWPHSTALAYTTKTTFSGFIFDVGFRSQVSVFHSHVRPLKQLLNHWRVAALSYLGCHRQLPASQRVCDQARGQAKPIARKPKNVRALSTSGNDVPSRQLCRFPKCPVRRATRSRSSTPFRIQLQSNNDNPKSPPRPNDQAQLQAQRLDWSIRTPTTKPAYLRDNWNPTKYPRRIRAFLIMHLLLLFPSVFLVYRTFATKPG